MFSHKFEHPMSTPHYSSLPLILSATHMISHVKSCRVMSCQVTIRHQPQDPGDLRHSVFRVGPEGFYPHVARFLKSYKAKEPGAKWFKARASNELQHLPNADRE